METATKPAINHAAYEDYIGSAYERLHEVECDLTGAIEELEIEPDSEVGFRLNEAINKVSFAMSLLEEVLEYPKDEEDEEDEDE